MKEELKKINDKFQEPERKLKKLLPDNYINKTIFRIATVLIILVCLYAAYTIKFDFKNYYQIECKATEPQPCLNPFYICFHKDNTTRNNTYINISDSKEMLKGLALSNLNGCNDLNEKEICSQDLCNIQYLEPGQKLGKQKPDMDWVTWTSILILLLAIIVNDINWRMRKNGNKTNSQNNQR